MMFSNTCSRRQNLSGPANIKSMEEKAMVNRSAIFYILSGIGYMTNLSSADKCSQVLASAFKIWVSISCVCSETAGSQRHTRFSTECQTCMILASSWNVVDCFVKQCVIPFCYQGPVIHQFFLVSTCEHL